MDLDARHLRTAFGSFVTGVTIVTVGGPVPHAMTANSFTSVSLAPALLLVCVAKDASMHHRLETQEHLGISVLGEGHHREARWFADPTRPRGPAQFADVPTEIGPRTGVPLISAAIATFECRRREMYWGGDHSIVLAEVIDAASPHPDPSALVCLRGKLHRWSARSPVGLEEDSWAT
ncbi:flavin reductase family protein [Myceligenerans salitolerans]|uniref:Flavin reductase family protein n=1 Tax=Myceligenerans salitolerans TaxID=1230528 RepID=A0ABS3IDV2_9MICO|nr:flavin reductase family protein [Myceligenerans salitolerans]MBO0611224.1 flavin reductase family protein [Myceligenerans salitolerans]